MRFILVFALVLFSMAESKAATPISYEITAVSDSIVLKDSILYNGSTVIGKYRKKRYVEKVKVNNAIQILDPENRPVAEAEAHGLRPGYYIVTIFSSDEKIEVAVTKKHEIECVARKLLELGEL
jgi:hypothetical protein